MNSAYLEWLKSGNTLVFGGNCCWRKYSIALIPAHVVPFFAEITVTEALALLKDTGAWLLRYSAEPTDIETPWWYVVCDKYSTGNLSSNMRNQVKKGHKNCVCRRVPASWLAQNGYQCYQSAFSRYKGTKCVSEEQFLAEIMSTIDGPHEYWGVFHDGGLVGFGLCITEGNMAAISSLKYDPRYLKYYPSYAMIDTLAHHYVTERKMVLSNGNRSVSHDTNMQEFLGKFGFKKQFCLLKIVYQPWLKWLMMLTFPFRAAIDRLPKKSFFAQFQALLLQEAIRRDCCP